MKESPRPATGFSGRLFYRSYFAVVLCIVIIGSALDYLGSRISDSDQVEWYQDQVQPVFSLINYQLKTIPETEWPLRVQQLSSEMSREIHLFEVSDFTADPEFYQQLEDGQLVPLFDHQDELTFYQRLQNSSQILAIAAPGFNTASTNQVWLVTAFYTLIAVAIFFLLRPFTRDLLKLKSAAATLGQDDFSTRIHAPQHSTLMPIVDAFNRMAARVEGLVTSQRDLTNAVSHELRTPLARLKFAFEALEAEAPSLNQSLDDMRKDVVELESLIEEMLCYAEINQIQSLDTAIVSLDTLIHQAVETECTPPLKVTVDYQSPASPELQIECAAHHLLRALKNVLRNAVRFTSSDCHISIRQTETELVIDIDDDGPGLSTDHADRIFEPFYKVDRRNQPGGFGLGLSIASSIAQKHQGQLILAESRLGGACFRFKLPDSIVDP